MSKQSLKKEIQKLQRTVEKAPRDWKFRRLRVIPADDWKYGDWSKFPDRYHLLAVMCNGTPKDWLTDYFALLEKIKDPEFGRHRCYRCAINQAQEGKKEIDRRRTSWQEQGGEEAKQQFYEKCSEPLASEFQRHDAMRDAEWRFFNEAAGAENRTCDAVNYFKCPYGDEWRTLIKDGYTAHEVLEHIEWYDRHCNGSTSWSPTPSERKWYHFGEPAIIDVQSLEDMLKAMEDGRLQKIIQEHERYMKETGAEIWNL